MPAFATHYLFMRDMLPWIEDNVCFNIHTQVMALGAQGPDIFFFGRLLPVRMPGKPQASKGVALHNAKAGEIIDAFCDYVKESQYPEIAMSYIYGFIMHYVLDRTCHPYVYAIQEELVDNGVYANNSTAHNTIEHSMDTCMIKEKLGYDIPYLFDGAATIALDDTQTDEVSRLLQFVIPRVTDCRVTHDDVTNTVKDLIWFQNTLRDFSGKLTRRCRILETLVAPVVKNYRLTAHINPRDLEKAKKYANIEHKAWHSPYQPDVQRDESFFDLYNRAISEAEIMLTGFQDVLNGAMDGYELTKNISFLTGIEA